MFYSNLKNAINHYVETIKVQTNISGYRLNTLLNDMADTISALGLSATLGVDNRTLGNDIIVSTGDKIIGQTDLLLSEALGNNYYYAGPNYLFQQWDSGLGDGNTDFILQGGGTQIFSHLFMDIQCDTGLYRFFSGTGTNKIGIFQFTGLTDDRTFTFPDKSGTVALLDDIPTQPLIYKALLSQNAPIASQTSGVFIIGQIWEILDYKEGVADTYDTLVGGTGYSTANGVATTGGTGAGLTVNIVDTAGVITGLTINAGGEGYTIGDTITVTGGGADATINIIAVLFDDFSNMELISGVMNTTGAFIRATSTTPTDWSNGSDLAYDGSPYIVSTDVNGDFNPFINTTGVSAVYSYQGIGDGLLTMAGLFTDKSKITYKIGKAQDGTKETLMYYNDTNSLGIGTGSFDGIPANNVLNYTPFEIEVNP